MIPLPRYENGEQEHCLELWNRDGKVSLPWAESFRRNIIIFTGSALERHAVFVRDLFCLRSLKLVESERKKEKLTPISKPRLPREQEDRLSKCHKAEYFFGTK